MLIWLAEISSGKPWYNVEGRPIWPTLFSVQESNTISETETVAQQKAMNLLICITSINKYTALFVESLLFHTTTLGMVIMSIQALKRLDGQKLTIWSTIAFWTNEREKIFVI